MNWLYQIKTNTVKESKELIKKLWAADHKGFHYKDYALKKPITIVINDDKWFSFDSDWADDDVYGKKLDYIKDIDFINKEILNVIPALKVKKYPYKKITSIEPGDIYCANDRATILIVRSWNNLYSLFGNGGLNSYSAFQNRNKDVIIDWLNGYEAVLIKNIDTQVIKSLELCKKEFDAEKE